MRTPTEAVKIAIDHVRTIYPQVTMVVFNNYSQHQYMDDNFNSPTFDERINVGLLEEASMSIDDFPAVFHLYAND